ncbi:hypothetical protein GCM10027277_26920 [Pseudoduganella ginsengisoli]|uniref:Uncharacterized protein n=1 Tax=Pseudoduganella ginsengisoli TaxID=1462440 RepID=A0A6L6Q2F6_9BURK|nr:hypothetical protein [Pseudoduganella ginsengisoli]MTW03501.1 hypothetical protein [Pseudoduganella ginsengisoli]
MKINELKLGLVMGEARERHKRQAEVEALLWAQIESTKKANQQAKNVNTAVTGPDEPGLSKMERKIRLIEAAAKKRKYDVMCIPTGGKKALAADCAAPKGSPLATESQFEGAWREALAQKRVRTRRHDDYGNH